MMQMQKTTIQTYLKQNMVLTISGLLAILSMLLIPPSIRYIKYIDFRVLTLLFCLMLVVSGLQKTGLFHAVSTSLLKKAHSIRQLSLILIFISFLGSMFITNDVALIAFVPFTILVLQQASQENESCKQVHSHVLIMIIVFQTIFANLGSMLTPIGNPQNLYLYSLSNMSLFEFFQYTLPLTLLSFVMLLLSCRFCIPNIPIQIPHTKAPSVERKSLLQNSILFFLCLLTVAHILPWQLLLILLSIAVFLFDKRLFFSVDYGLLATFLFFFIFIGNMSEFSLVKNLLQNLLEGKEILVSSLTSQVISNVPCAILLSNFTTSYGKLLVGVNIGGLGTLIASLASLISWQQYRTIAHANPRKYFITFTIYNVVFFLILLGFSLIYYG